MSFLLNIITVSILLPSSLLIVYAVVVRLWGWPRSTKDPFYHSRYRFFFLFTFCNYLWWYDLTSFSRYNTISSAAHWKTLGNYDGLVDKLCLAALGSDFCWPSLSKFFLCQPQFQVRVLIYITWYKAGPVWTHALEDPQFVCKFLQPLGSSFIILGSNFTNMLRKSAVLDNFITWIQIGISKVLFQTEWWMFC